MDLPISVWVQGLSGFWNRILVASVTARAGLSEACAISYIQYIGVVSAGLPSTTRGGKPPNSPIAILDRFLFAAQHSAESVIMRQCAARRFDQPLQHMPPQFHGKMALIRRRRAASRDGGRCAGEQGMPQSTPPAGL